ncbi:hypothetical protein HK104_009580 [Borealophlyctis nickersoniae]|nr:hypothetical protein HK104_009580 [Borealophlyctis nickersoniae]
MNVTSVQHRILELIQQWNSTLCVSSRYKEDFKHINDMYRLLQYKGYRFPAMSKEAANVLAPPQGLKTEEELEAEDKIAQGAKLQELLRLGTPAALEQANDLMKIMSGYDMERRPDYKKEVDTELDRIEQRVILLNDMLNQKKPEDRWQKDSTVEELYGSAKAAQLRIQKLVEGGDDDERMARLLELNDLINTVIQKHEDFKKGNPISQSGIDKRETRAPPPKELTEPAKAGPISLIDLDDWSGPATSPASTASPSSGTSGPSPSAANIPAPSGGLGGLMDDLSSLNFSVSKFVNTTSMPSHPPGYSGALPSFSTPLVNMGPAGGFGGQPLSQPATPGHPAQSLSLAGQLGGLGMQQGFGQPQKAMGQTAFHGLVSFGASSPAATPSRGGTPQPAQRGTTPQPGTPQLGGDYFSGAKPAPQAGTPSAQPQSDPFGGLDFLSGTGAAQTAAATPAGSQKREVWKDKSWMAQATFINVTPVPFTDLVFQLAVPKSMALKMDQLSGTTVAPLNQAQVTQALTISNPTKEILRLRFRVQYAVNGAQVNEQGDYSDNAAPA